MKLEVTLQHRRLEVNSDDILTNPELVIIDFRSRYKGDSGVHTGNSPTEYDDVWIDPEGDAATAQYILADNGKSVQENLDEADKKMFQLLTKAPNTLPVTVTGTATAPIYTFTKANFDIVAQSYANGAQIFVDFTDNRTAANKPVDLSRRYDALWNKTLSQVEVRNSEVARGFYLNGTTPAHRGCVSSNTAMYLSIDSAMKFNPSTGFYEYNKLYDLTELDASYIYSYTVGCMKPYDIECYNVNNTFIRTNYTFTGLTGVGGADIGRKSQGLFANCSNLETINVGGRFRPSNAVIHSGIGRFSNCYKLKEIIGGLNYIFCGTIATLTNTEFEQCSRLETLTIGHLQTNINFQWSPNLTLSSIEFMIINRLHDNVINLTLHQTAFGRLTPEVIALASSKNINLVSI